MAAPFPSADSWSFTDPVGRDYSVTVLRGRVREDGSDSVATYSVASCAARGNGRPVSARSGGPGFDVRVPAGSDAEAVRREVRRRTEAEVVR